MDSRPTKAIELRAEFDVGSLDKNGPATKDSKALACEGQRLRVKVETKQLSIGAACIQDPPGVSPCSYGAVYISLWALWADCEYNVLVKNRLVRWFLTAR